VTSNTGSNTLSGDAGFKATIEAKERPPYVRSAIVPVRGQIAWLIPQEGVHYGLYYKGVNVLGRRDGIVVQPNLGGEEEGWNDTNEQPDRAAAVAGVEVIQELYSRMAKMPKRNS
jgi:hypothetical protein